MNNEDHKDPGNKIQYHKLHHWNNKDILLDICYPRHILVDR